MTPALAAFGARFVAARLLKRVPDYVLVEALRRAYTHLVRSELTRPWQVSHAVGRAGELAAGYIARWRVGSSGAAAVDLYEISPKFPVIDLLGVDRPYSVKMRHIQLQQPPPDAPARAHIAWEKKVCRAYARDLYDIIRDARWMRKRERAAKLLLANLATLRQRGVLVNELRGEPTLADAIEFVRRRTILVVPADHFRCVENHVGQLLRERYHAGKLDVLGIPQGLTSEEVAPWITNIMATRLKANGVTAADLRGLLEIARRLPSIQQRLGTNEPWPPSWGSPPF